MRNSLEQLNRISLEQLNRSKNLLGHSEELGDARLVSQTAEGGACKIEKLKRSVRMWIRFCFTVTKKLRHLSGSELSF